MIAIIAVFCGNLFAQSNTTDKGIVINGVTWATRNVDKPGTFAEKPESAGMLYHFDKQTVYNSTDQKKPENWENTQSESVKWQAASDPSPSGWRVPTALEIESLLDESKVKREWNNEKKGVVFTDKKTNASVFFPAPSYRVYTGGISDGVAGIYLCNEKREYAGKPYPYSLFLENHWGSITITTNYPDGRGAYSIRPVKAETTSVGRVGGGYGGERPQPTPNPTDKEKEKDKDKDKDKGEKIIDFVGFEANCIPCPPCVNGTRNLDPAKNYCQPCKEDCPQPPKTEEVKCPECPKCPRTATQEAEVAKRDPKCPKCDKCPEDTKVQKPPVSQNCKQEECLIPKATTTAPPLEGFWIAGDFCFWMDGECFKGKYSEIGENPVIDHMSKECQKSFLNFFKGSVKAGYKFENGEWLFSMNGGESFWNPGSNEKQLFKQEGNNITLYLISKGEIVEQQTEHWQYIDGKLYMWENNKDGKGSTNRVCLYKVEK